MRPLEAAETLRHGLRSASARLALRRRASRGASARLRQIGRDTLKHRCAQPFSFVVANFMAEANAFLEELTGGSQKPGRVVGRTKPQCDAQLAGLIAAAAKVCAQLLKGFDHSVAVSDGLKYVRQFR